MKLMCLIFSFFIINVKLYAQYDRIVCFDVNTSQVSVLGVVQSNFDYKIFENPNYQFSVSNIISSNYSSESRFSDMIAMSKIMSNEIFPATAAVKISAIHGDTTWDKCSGMFVGESYVLTAAHCVFSDYGEWNDLKYFNKYLYVMPGYDNGEVSKFGKVKVQKIYIFQSYYNGNTKRDVAMLKLEKPAGLSAGWVKMKNIDDIDKIKNTEFFNLSYPMDASALNLSKNYNGDTLYFKHGKPDYIDYCYIGIKRPGIPGESGSLLLYDDENMPAACGVRNFSEETFSFYRLTNDDINSFYQLIYPESSVINKSISSISSKVKIYPNPIFEKAVINTDTSISNILVSVIDNKNIEVYNTIIEGKNGHFVFTDYRLLPGNYTMLIKHSNRIISVSKIVIKK